MIKQKKKLTIYLKQDILLLFLDGIQTYSTTDVITPQKGGIKLNLGQRVLLRVFARFHGVYVTLPRGSAKTHGNMMGEFHEAIWYPRLQNSMSAETKDQSAKILKEKWNEIKAQFPALEEELLEKPSFQKDTAELKWKNGSKTDNLANSHSTKGLRRHRIRIEESARLNNELFDDALKPVADTIRYTVGEGIENPKELNNSIHFFTTTTFRGCDEHKRTNTMIDEMCKNMGSFVFGADWRMPVQFGMKKKSFIDKEMRTMNPVAFDMNYGMQWVGATEDALINMQLISDARTIECASLEPVKDREYIIAVDVAKSKDAKNNKTIFTVLGFTRNKDNTVADIFIEMMTSPPSSKTYEAQTIELKRLANVFNPNAIVVDAQSYGQGFIEACTNAYIDPYTGKSTDKYATMNEEGEYGLDVVGNDALPIIYSLKSTSAIETKIIVNFMGQFQAGRVKLLCNEKAITFIKKYEKDMKKKATIEQAHINITRFTEEVANLKAKKLNNGKLTIEKVTRKLDKDRYSSITYGLYYIMQFENIFEEHIDDDINDYCLW